MSASNSPRVQLRNPFPPSTGQRRSTGLSRTALEQSQFLKALCVERKRSERAHKPLLLAVLDGSRAFAADESAALRSRVIEALLRATRDTDLLGWYQQDSVIGILFTETSSCITAVSTVRGRVVASLQNALSPEQAGHIAVSVYVFPGPDQSGGPPGLIFYPEIHNSAGARFTLLKRTIDVLGSLAAISLCWPLWLAIALMIKATSAGPVFYRQTRIGQYGVAFTFLKFRSMYVDCDSRIHEEYISRLISGAADVQNSDGNGHHVYKLTDDPRVTPFGRLLRRTSLDELPQFLNVLLGDMSLVGPRPPLPYEVTRYEPWHHRRVVTVKPGITGLWQVSGRSRTTFEEMVRLDLRYVEQASIALDLKILLHTPRAILLGTGY